MMSDQAIVFLTHFKSKRVFRHFQRLQDETRGLLETLLCIHNPVRQRHKSQRILAALPPLAKASLPAPDFEIDLESGRSLLPNRFVQMRERNAWYNLGFTDLAYMPALLSKRLSRYEYIWVLENDVDYAGNWRDFFNNTMGSRADLLSSYIYTRNQNSDWEHWTWFNAPAEVSFDHHTSSFNPVVRFSRRMLTTYVKSVRNDLWRGHHEALYPTIARHNGLKICDLGGAGAFCPKQWRDKHYHNPLVNRWNNREPGRGELPPNSSFWFSDGGERRQGVITGVSKTAYCNPADKVTYICAPNVQSAYYHETPIRYLERGVLYHPVKVGQARFLILRRLLRPLKAALQLIKNNTAPAASKVPARSICSASPIENNSEHCSHL
jgi:hypothetical protein